MSDISWWLMGSSPRVRGACDKSYDACPHRRVIPARAGSIGVMSFYKLAK